MAYTLPTFSALMDNAFTQTWYEIKPEAIDNILLATPVWAAMKQAGCFKPQVGGTKDEETIRYGVGPTPTAVKKGDVLPSGTVETKTVAFWDFRNVAVHVQRDLFDDVENAGKFKIVDYVEQRMTEARDALSQKFETDILATADLTEVAKEIRSLNDVVPAYADAATGTNGGIARPATYAQVGTTGTYSPATGNTWWGPHYQVGVAPMEVNLVQDMTHAWNVVDANQNEPPSLIVTTQDMFEIYGTFAEDKTQIIKDATTGLANLGFSVYRFKGCPFVWTPNMTAKHMLMLNLKWIQITYDPQLWFDMTPWKDVSATDTTRLAHILCRMTGPRSKQPRRHIRLYYA